MSGNHEAIDVSFVITYTARIGEVECAKKDHVYNMRRVTCTRVEKAFVQSPVKHQKHYGELPTRAA